MPTADGHDNPSHSDLIPTDEADATRRFEAVRALDPTALAGLGKQDLLLAWWSFFWLEAALHPDDAEVWPEEVSEALPPPPPRHSAVSRRARSKTVNTTQPKPSATASCTSGRRVPKLTPNTKPRTRPKRDRSERHSRMREGGPVRENSPPLYGAGFL